MEDALCTDVGYSVLENSTMAVILDCSNVPVEAAEDVAARCVSRATPCWEHADGRIMEILTDVADGDLDHDFLLRVLRQRQLYFQKKVSYARPHPSPPSRLTPLDSADGRPRQPPRSCLPTLALVTSSTAPTPPTCVLARRSRQLGRTLDAIAAMDGLASEPPTFWAALLRTYFLDAPSCTVSHSFSCSRSHLTLLKHASLLSSLP